MIYLPTFATKISYENVGIYASPMDPSWAFSTLTGEKVGLWVMIPEYVSVSRKKCATVQTTRVNCQLDQLVTAQTKLNLTSGHALPTVDPYVKKPYEIRN